MNNRAFLLIRAVRGPLLLITLGVLLMLQRTTGFHLGQSWPVFVIVFGVLKLAERAAVQSGAGNFPPPPVGADAPPPPPPPPPPQNPPPPAGGSWT